MSTLPLCYVTIYESSNLLRSWDRVQNQRPEQKLLKNVIAKREANWCKRISNFLDKLWDSKHEAEEILTLISKGVTIREMLQTIKVVVHYAYQMNII